MLVKYRNCNVPAYKDDFFTDYVSRRYYGNGFGYNPAVNIIEEDNAFRIEIAAAGISKKEFKIKVNDDMLTVSADRREDKKDKHQNYARREFNYGKFSRSFRLGESIDQENIRAEYNEGVLNIHLAKKEEAKKPETKEIEVN